ncbi:hypothetical protein GLYMA_U003166v4 [Glycine max]|nr:hypothetical protein GLYMA_U003166v4 [Glycine max]
MKIPLGVVGSPLEMVLQVAKPLNQIPLVGPLLTPPVNVTAVAKVAVTAATATDPVFPRGSLTPMEYNVYCQNKSKLELSFFCFLGKSNLGRFASEYLCFTIIVKLRIFLHTKSLKE